MPGKNFKLFCSGFSLVEILVSIGIMALVAAVAMPNLRQFSRDQEITGAANQLLNTLRTAQSSAASHIKCPGGQTSANWNVVLNTSNYTLNANCTSDQAIFSNRSYSLAQNSTTTFQLTNNTCTAGQPVTITFTNQQISYTCAGSTGLWPITLTLSGSGQTKAVIVEQGGIIRTQ